MNSTPFVQQLKAVYDRYKKRIVFLLLFVGLILVYFRDFFSPWSDNLISATIAFVIAILMDTLYNLEDFLLESKKSKDFTTVNSTTDMICNIIEKERKKVDLKIIAATANNTIYNMFPQILRAAEHAQVIDICIHVINPDGIASSSFPFEWKKDVETSIYRIKNEYAPQYKKLKISIYQYDNIPVIHGILLNDSHLFLGFFGWTQLGGADKFRLGGADKPHRYYTSTDPSAKYFFDVFKDWFEHSPGRIIYEKESVS